MVKARAFLAYLNKYRVFILCNFTSMNHFTLEQKKFPNFKFVVGISGKWA